MGIRDDIERYRKVGEEQREDLADFIKYGDLNRGSKIQVPIKIVELPSFEYDRIDMGGVGKGEGADVGDPVDVDEDGDDDGDDGEAGEEGGEHDYYEMDPEEFAKELDKELGLDLEPKGKQVVEEMEGDLKDKSRSGPDSLLDFETMFKKGLKRKMAIAIDEEYLREVLKVRGYGPRRAFEWARERNVPVSVSWFENEYDDIPADKRSHWDEIDDIPGELDRNPVTKGKIDDIPLRTEDKRYRYPEIEEKREKNVVVVNIRDVSGSMGAAKQELVERVFTPMDWYLQGKYDNAEFIYIAHDAQAWEVARDDFFGIQSGGGTRVSTAFELAQQLLEERYPWSDWNRFVFAAGDGENLGDDTQDALIPLMQDMKANRQAYVETTISGSRNAHVADEIDKEFEGEGNIVVSRVSSEDDVTDAIYNIISGDTNE